MLKSLSNFIGWLNRLETDFLHESYSHIKICIMAYKFEEENYTITHLKLQLSSKSEGKSKWYYSIKEKAVFIEYLVIKDKLLEMFSFDDDGLSLRVGTLNLNFKKNLNLPHSYESYLKMVRSRHGEYIGYRSSSLMSFLYLNHLYNEDGTYIAFDPNETQSIYPILLIDYPKQLFIKDGDILNGREMIDEAFGTSYLTFSVPILIIEYHIESFKFRSTGKIIENKFIIKIEWDIKKEYENVININYFILEKKYPVTLKSLKIEEKFADEFLMIDFLILWKGDSRLVPENSRVFWRFYHSLQNISEIRERIKEYKKDIRKTRKTLRTNGDDIEEKMSSYAKISDLYGKIAGEFRYLSGSSAIDFTKKSWLYQRLEGKYYGKFLSIYKNQIPPENQNIQTYLWLATLLFRNFKQDKDFVFREKNRRILESTHYSYIGASPHYQINQIYYRINDATKLVQEKLNQGYLEHDYFTLLDNFEILGDLHIHMGLLELISDDRNFQFRIRHNDLNIAMRCYEKAHKYEIKTEIPGVGRLSVYVQNYMPIFHKFIENSYLEKKIEFLKDIIDIPKETAYALLEEEPHSVHKTIENLIDEIYDQSKKIGIKRSDISLFLRQFEKDNLKLPMAILLSKTNYRSIQEVGDDLLRLINQKVEDYKNTILIFIPGTELKSNTFCITLVSKRGGYKFDVLKLDNNLLGKLEKLDKKKKYDLVFLDDVIGTGRQFITTFDIIFGNNLEEIGKNLNNLPNIKFSLLASFGSLESRKNISQKLPFFRFDNISYANLIREDTKAFSHDPNISKDELERLKQFLKESDEDYWDGDHSSEFLVILEHGAPNNSIGCFWRDDSKIRRLWKRIHY